MTDERTPTPPGEPDACDAPLSALRGDVDDIATSLGIWTRRSQAGPDAHARRAANAAMDAIDRALTSLHEIRATLIGETRDWDDAATERADALLRKLRNDRAGQ